MIPASRGGGAHLLDYWAVLVRRRWVVYLVIASSLLVALLGSFLATPRYRATASVRVERLNPDTLDFREGPRMDYSWAAYSDFYQTQYKILASDAVARLAAERFNLASHPQFLPSESKKPGLLARIKRALPSRASRVELDRLDVAVARLRAGLEIAPVRNSQLIRVSWVGTDPELAALVANSVVDAYTQFNLESKFSTSDQATEFLINQIGQLKREIAAIEERFQEYGESKRIISIDDSNNITLQALSDISQRRTEAQTRLARSEASYNATLNASPDALPEVLNSSLINRLKEEYAGYEADYSEKSRLFKDGWPGMRSLQSKLDQARERLSLETNRIARQVSLSAESEYLKARAEVSNLDRLLVEHEGAAQTLKRDAVEFANLQSEAQKKRETLTQLIARQNAMALSTRLQDLETTSSNIRLVDRARAPIAPYSPDTGLNLLLGLIAGVGLGIGMAFFLDYMDNTVTSHAQLEALTSLPLLAAIPRHVIESAPLARVRRDGAKEAAAPVDLVAHRDYRAGTAEAYRELRTALLLSSPGNAPREIMITSALPEEGKSATALNLAAVLAQMGRRVLLVDTDLRRPRLHEAFGVDNRAGVSTLLSGLAGNPLEMVRSTDIESLDVLVSGPIPPNPSELLNSKLFEEAGSRFLEHGYDHVIYDSPPALSVADPVIIGSVVDAVIVVIRANRTPRQSLVRAVEKLEQSGIKPIGVVLNDFKADSPGYAGYHYGRYADPDAGDDAGASSPPQENRAGGR